MTCYHRHLKDLFVQLDLPYDPEGRRRVHAAVLDVLGLPADERCPQVWAALKAAYGPAPGEHPDLVRDLAGVMPAG